MRTHWLTAIVVLLVVALASAEAAGRRLRRVAPCPPQPCLPQPVLPDLRLATDKRPTPEFQESPELRLFGFSARRGFVEPDAETFTVRRHDRGVAKTTYAHAPLEVFPSLSALIRTLPRDEAMVPRVRTDWDFDRIVEERRNVQVTAYLFAIKKESDNDYHLIVDDDGAIEEGAKFNVEVSDIPNEGPDMEAIREVRDSFKHHFDGRPPRSYRPFLTPPLKVRIEGSLFFDRDHPAGAVGPEGYRPGSAWEIHPVRRITFLGD